MCTVRCGTRIAVFGTLMLAVAAFGQSRRVERGGPVPIPPVAPSVAETSAVPVVRELDEDQALQVLRSIQGMADSERTQAIFSARRHFPALAFSTNMGVMESCKVTLNRYGIRRDGLRFRTPKNWEEGGHLVICAPTGAVTKIQVACVRDKRLVEYWVPILEYAADAVENPPLKTGTIQIMRIVELKPDEEYVVWLYFRDEAPVTVCGGVNGRRMAEDVIDHSVELRPGLMCLDRGPEYGAGLRPRLTPSRVLKNGIVHSDRKVIDYAVGELHADINADGMPGIAFHYADEDTILYLIGLGMDVQKKNPHSGGNLWEDLSYRGNRGEVPKAAKILAERGVKVTPATLIQLVSGAKADTVEVLIAAGTDMKIRVDEKSLYEYFNWKITSGSVYEPSRRDKMLKLLAPFK